MNKRHIQAFLVVSAAFLAVNVPARPRRIEPAEFQAGVPASTAPAALPEPAWQEERR